MPHRPQSIPQLGTAILRAAAALAPLLVGLEDSDLPCETLTEADFTAPPLLRAHDPAPEPFDEDMSDDDD